MARETQRQELTTEPVAKTASQLGASVLWSRSPRLRTLTARGIIANVTIEQASRSECSGCARTRVKVTLLCRKASLENQ